MRALCVVSSVMSVFLIGSPVFAASVSAVKGQVSINRGSGYSTLSGQTSAKAGDTVMTSPNGAANIAYGNGCILPVAAGSVVVVPPDSACVPGATTAGSGNSYLIGGAILAAGVGGAVLLGGSGGSKSASP